MAVKLLWLLRYPLEIHSDAAANLYCGGLITAGKIPYVDFYDANQPMTFYLHAIPCFLSESLAIHKILAFNICVLLLSAFSAVVSYRIVSSHNKVTASLIALSIAALGLVVGDMFGQREHLFVLLYMPFFFTTWLRSRQLSSPAYTAVIAGLCAGLGVFLKPYFLALAIAVELFFVLTSNGLRSLLRAEVGTLAFVGAVYSSAIFLTPHLWEGFSQRVFPLLINGYDAYSCSFWHALSLSGFEYVRFTMLLALLLGFLYRHRESLLPPLLILELAGYLLYVWQRKGWPHQLIVAEAASIMIVLLVLPILIGASEHRLLALSKKMKLATSGDGEPSSKTEGVAWSNAAQSVLISALCVLAFNTIELTAAQSHSHRDAGNEDIEQVILRNSRSGDPILFLGCAMDGFPTLVQLNRVHAYRYVNLFTLAALEYQRAAATSVLGSEPKLALINKREQQLYEEISKDIERYQPRLIFVRTPNVYTPNMSLIDVFNRDIITARQKPRYECLGTTVPNYTVFRLKNEAARSRNE